MFRLVAAEDTTSPRGEDEILRKALNYLTLGKSPPRVPTIFFSHHEADALYELLRGRGFTKRQLDKWVEDLVADPPYDRKRPDRPHIGLWKWIRYLFGGPEPPERPQAETIEEWMERAKLFIRSQRSMVSNSQWIDRLRRLLRDIVNRQRTGERVSLLVMDWALIHLLVIPRDGHDDIDDE